VAAGGDGPAAVIVTGVYGAGKSSLAHGGILWLDEAPRVQQSLVLPRRRKALPRKRRLEGAGVSRLSCLFGVGCAVMVS
jgi:hypothetical protein